MTLHSTDNTSWASALDTHSLTLLTVDGDPVSAVGTPSAHRSQMLNSLDLETDLDLEQQGNADLRPLTRANSNAKKRLKQTITGKNKRISGTSGNDILDASKGKGRIVLKGKGGNDTLKGKKNDRLLGGGGHDRIDTRKGRKNMLKGGGGNDTLFAGTRDTVFGNGGADTLDASKGKGRNTLKGGGGPDVLIGKMGDRLVGGNGGDEFVLINRTLPSKPLIVQDFQKGHDRLSIRKMADAPLFSELEFRQQGQNTVVAVQGQDIAILEDVTAPQLQANDFEGLTIPPQLSVGNITAIEGNPGDSSQATFIISLNQALDQDVIVNYQTAGITAIANTDYTPRQGSITILAGKTAQPLNVSIVRDFDDEAWLKILANNPQLFRAPIAVRGRRAVFCETPTAIYRLAQQ